MLIQKQDERERKGESREQIIRSPFPQKLRVGCYKDR